eukprot:9333971-Pyramimonas_sp.AAC.1
MMSMIVGDLTTSLRNQNGSGLKSKPKPTVSFSLGEMTTECSRVTANAAIGRIMRKRLQDASWISTVRFPYDSECGDYRFDADSSSGLLAGVVRSNGPQRATRVSQALRGARLCVDEAVLRTPRTAMHIFHIG